MQFLSTQLKRQSGFLAPLLGVCILLLALSGFGAATTHSARFRALASEKESAGDVAQRALESFLNLAWNDSYLRDGQHPMLDETLNADLATLKWEVSTKGPRLKKIKLVSPLLHGGNAGSSEISIVGYKYDDF